MIKHSLIALALAALLPVSAQAAAPSYTYVEGGYINFDGDADGFGVRGSFNFGDSDFYGFGSYAKTEIDNTNFDLNLADFGVGYHHALSDRTHLLAEIAHVNLNVDNYFSIGDVLIDAKGYRASVGVRSAFSDKVEGLLKANYTDGSDFDGAFSATTGLLFKLNSTWGLTGEVGFEKYGSRTYLAGVRASF